MLAGSRSKEHAPESIASLKYRGRAVIVGVSGRDPERLDPLALWANSTDVQGVYYPGIFPRELIYTRF